MTQRNSLHQDPKSVKEYYTLEVEKTQEKDERRPSPDHPFTETKGKKTTRKVICDRAFWRGGTESLVFNKLEEFAEQERPRTPVLAAGITEALMRRYINKGGFMTSRINWAIQSSGVDYLHLLIISMDYLIRRFNLAARLAITVHDEIRYLVKEEDKYRAAMALQVANVWTRAMFSQQMGIDDLPQSCAYFSAVDIDHVLRKEVDMDCVTPSHPEAIPHGESLNITQLLAKGELARLDPSVVPEKAPELDKWAYAPRQSVMDGLQDSFDLTFLKAQLAGDENELREILRGVRQTKPQTQRSYTSNTSYSSTTSSTSRSRGPPAHAQPQAVELPDIGTMLRQRFRTGPDDYHHRAKQRLFPEQRVVSRAVGRI